MTDPHPHAGYAVHDGRAIGGFASDPLFGSLPGTYDAGYVGHGQDGQAVQDGHGGSYGTSPWNGVQQTPVPGQDAVHGGYGFGGGHDPYAAYDAYGHAGTAYGTYGGGYDQAAAYQQAPQVQHPASAHGHAPHPAHDQPSQHPSAHAPAGYEPTAVFDATPFREAAPQDTAPPDASFPQPAAPSFSDAPADYQPTMQWTVPDSYEHDAVWYAAQETIVGPLVVPEELHRPDERPGEHPVHRPAPDRAAPDRAAPDRAARHSAPHHGSREQTAAGYGDVPEDPGPAPDDAADHLAETMAAPVVRIAEVPVRPVGGRGSRRRQPARKSALLTIAVPSACVMGVAGIAAASVGGIGGDDGQDDKTALATADTGQGEPVAANTRMDTQLRALSADAQDFGDRASRTQERIDLKARQDAEKKKRDAEAAHKEAMRPKFLLPVEQRGLSAYFGQAGVNWMSVHTGIDFPVQPGTPVMAATDGTVRTQWNSSYGNMAIVTAPDGTETWYCHLSSTKVRSGSVKAGDLIAYSGNTGNTTGPHLHFEVRPGGGAAIDPLPWLRGHGLDPT